MVAELTNQQFAAISYPSCPRCGYRMQLLMANQAVSQFVCYRHDEPYYHNHHTGIKRDTSGRVAS
jgi:hypothetical protein